MSKYSEVFIATTDTVTGIGAPMTMANREAIYELKQRDKSKPIVVMVGSLSQARNFKEWDELAEKYAKQYWPGATTLILSSSLAMRMPANQPLCDYIQKIGPIWMTSANISGQRPLDFETAKTTFKDIKHAFDFGPGSGQPSQLIDVKTGKIIKR